jgi:hypothetical protein
MHCYEEFNQPFPPCKRRHAREPVACSARRR